MIKFNQVASLKSYIDKNIKVRTKAKNDLEKDSSKYMNNSVFGRTMDNVSTEYQARNNI